MLRPFVPRPVLRFIDAGQSAWTAELRPVTILFISVHGIAIEASDGPAHLQQVFAALQTEVYGSGGSITQFLVDDKGTTLVAAWGLPGHTHEDDSVRAAYAACRAVRQSTTASVRLSAGLASGRVFCGWRGNDRRREYAVIGTAVNRASRLAGLSTSTVACDQATARRIEHRARVESMGAVASSRQVFMAQVKCGHPIIVRFLKPGCAKLMQGILRDICALNSQWRRVGSAKT